MSHKWQVHVSQVELKRAGRPSWQRAMDWRFDNVWGSIDPRFGADKRFWSLKSCLFKQIAVQETFPMFPQDFPELSSPTPETIQPIATALFCCFLSHTSEGAFHMDRLCMPISPPSQNHTSNERELALQYAVQNPVLRTRVGVSLLKFVDKQEGQQLKGNIIAEFSESRPNASQIENFLPSPRTLPLQRTCFSSKSKREEKTWRRSDVDPFYKFVVARLPSYLPWEMCSLLALLKHYEDAGWVHLCPRLSRVFTRLRQGPHSIRARQRSGEGFVRRNGCPKGWFWRVRFFCAPFRVALKTPENLKGAWTTVSPHDTFSALLALLWRNPIPRLVVEVFGAGANQKGLTLK